MNENVTSTDDGLAASEDIPAMEQADSEEPIGDSVNYFSTLQMKIDDAKEYSTVKLDIDYAHGTVDSGEIKIDKALTIDGDGHTIDAKGKCRIFNVTNGGVVLKNIIFKNGHLDVGVGGAIFGDCTVMDCTFIGNYANGGGGAISRGSAVNCTFTGNSANVGGAISRGSAVNCTFVDNHAGYMGGAMYEGSAVNCTFTGNSVSRVDGVAYGGAMYSGSAVNCDFTNNSASTTGGAMYGGSAVNCDFTNNSASLAGALYGGYAYACIFKNNKAGRDSNDTYNTICSNPILDVYDSIIAYGSGDKLTFDLKTNRGVKVINRNIEVKIYKDNLLLMTQNCSSGEGIGFDLDLGTYLVVCRASEFDIEPVNVTVKIMKLHEFELVDVPDFIKDGEVIIPIIDTQGFNGTVGVEIDEIEYNLILVDGMGSLKLSNLSTGQKQVKVRILEDEYIPLTVLSNKFMVVAKTSFLTLSNDMDDAGDTLILNHDYVYDGNTDFEFISGIIVDGDLTVDGQGHSIDANGNARIFWVKGNLTLINITLKNGDAPNSIIFSLPIDTSYDGGAIHNEGTLTIIDSEFINNHAKDSGGAINNRGDLSIANSRFKNNNASNGAAIRTLEAKDLRLDNIKFIDNEGDSLYAEYGEIDVSGCKFLTEVIFNVNDFFDMVSGSAITVNVSEVKKAGTFSGNVAVIIGDEEYSVEVINGFGNLTVSPNLSPGKHAVVVVFNETDVYDSASARSNEFNVIVNPEIRISDISGFVEGGSISIDLVANRYFTGDVDVVIDGVNYTVSVVDGIGSRTISPELKPGDYVASISYAGNGNYTAWNSKSKVFTVSAKTVAGEDNASKSLVSFVKLTLKKVKVKRSAKKLKLQATLKVNGKAVKGKKVTFKFNGKTYRAKTNKKGVAKFTIKSKVLKKLKVGKKVKYQAGYGKTVVKRTVVVKK